MNEKQKEKLQNELMVYFDREEGCFYIGLNSDFKEGCKIELRK